MYCFISSIVQITICFLCHDPLPHLLSFAVTGRQIFYTRVRAQIINHMRHIKNFLLSHINSSLDSILTNSKMARNKVRGKGIEILNASSLVSTDVFVYTQFEDAY